MSIQHKLLTGDELHQPFKYGNDADKSANPQPGDWYFSGDTGIVYRCRVAGVWEIESIKNIIRDADGDTKVEVEKNADEDKVRMSVAGVEAFLLNTNGIIDLAKQSGCRLYVSSMQSIPGNSAARLDFVTADFDIQNEFDLVTTHRFTASRAGKYLMTLYAQLQYLPDTKSFLGIIKKNGVIKARDNWMNGSGAVASGLTSVATVLDLAAGDYIEFWVENGDSTARNVGEGAGTVFKIA